MKYFDAVVKGLQQGIEKASVFALCARIFASQRLENNAVNQAASIWALGSIVLAFRAEMSVMTSSQLSPFRTWLRIQARGSSSSSSSGATGNAHLSNRRLDTAHGLVSFWTAPRRIGLTPYHDFDILVVVNGRHRDSTSRLNGE